MCITLDYAYVNTDTPVAQKVADEVVFDVSEVN